MQEVARSQAGDTGGESHKLERLARASWAGVEASDVSWESWIHQGPLKLGHGGKGNGEMPSRTTYTQLYSSISCQRLCGESASIWSNQDRGSDDGEHRARAQRPAQTLHYEVAPLSDPEGRFLASGTLLISTEATQPSSQNSESESWHRLPLFLPGVGLLPSFFLPGPPLVALAPAPPGTHEFFLWHHGF